MPNIKIEYEYRDAGNFKLRSEVVLHNSKGLNLTEVNQKINSSLWEHEFFNPEDWGIPPLKFERYDREMDHPWHRILSIEETNEKAKIEFDISQLPNINPDNRL